MIIQSLTLLPITQLKDQWDWYAALWELWAENRQASRDIAISHFHVGMTKDDQINKVSVLRDEWLETRQHIARKGGLRRKNGEVYENLEQISIICESLENAYRAKSELSLRQLLRPYIEDNGPSAMDPEAKGFLFLDLFHYVLDHPLAFVDDQDSMQQVLGMRNTVASEPQTKGRLTIRADKVILDGLRELVLDPKPTKLLLFLISNHTDGYISRDVLVTEVLGSLSKPASDGVLNTHLSTIRREFEKHNISEPIETKPKVGVRLRSELL